MTEKNHDEKCLTRIHNLYRYLSGERTPHSIQFVMEEILETEKCQESHDLRHIRDRTKEELMAKAQTTPTEATPKAQAEALKKALEDDAVCCKVFDHYQTWYEGQVLRTLPLGLRAHYYFERHANKFTLAGSLMVGGYFGWAHKSPAVGAFASACTATVGKLFRREQPQK